MSSLDHIAERLGDVTAEIDPVNVPGTSGEHPDWRRRQSLTLEQLAAQSRMRKLAWLFDDAPASGAAQSDREEIRS